MIVNPVFGTTLLALKSIPRRFLASTNCTVKRSRNGVRMQMVFQRLGRALSEQDFHTSKPCVQHALIPQPARFFIFRLPLLPWDVFQRLRFGVSWRKCSHKKFHGGNLQHSAKIKLPSSHASHDHKTSGFSQAVAALCFPSSALRPLSSGRGCGSHHAAGKRCWHKSSSWTQSQLVCVR